MVVLETVLPVYFMHDDTLFNGGNSMTDVQILGWGFWIMFCILFGWYSSEIYYVCKDFIDHFNHWRKGD